MKMLRAISTIDRGNIPISCGLQKTTPGIMNISQVETKKTPVITKITPVIMKIS
jgi:hypothetical protein